MSNIIEVRKYLTPDKKRQLHPAETGVALVELMEPVFGFMNLDFTRGIEESLDEVAQGKKTYDDVVRAVNGGLTTELESFKQAHSYACPDCGKPLIHRIKKGEGGFDFWGCSAYPECTCRAHDDGGKPGSKIEPKAPASVTDFKCAECGKALLRRKGVSKGKDYDFFGCSGFPNCKASYQVKDEAPDFEKVQK